MVIRYLAGVDFRLKKQYYRNKNSAPMISGDAFQHAADLVISNDKSLSSAILSEANKVIFVKSDHANVFCSNFEGALSSKVLCFGNSDFENYDYEALRKTNARQIFAQNASLTTKQIQTLPIGIENVSLARNGLLKHFNPGFINRDKLGKMLVGPFSPTHREREVLWDSAKGMKDIELVENYLSPSRYAELSSNYAFIACPRGNGLDTHRFWEALYRGSYPVVVRSAWSEQISSLGIPVVEIDSWDLTNFEPVALVKKLPRIQPLEISALWLDFWFEKIRKF